MSPRQLSLPSAHYHRQLNLLSAPRQRKCVKHRLTESPAYLSLCYLSPARALAAYAECLFITIQICELTRRTDICKKRMNAVGRRTLPNAPPSSASLRWEWIPWQQNQFAAWGPFVGVLLFMWYDLCFTFPEVSTDTETRSSETWSTVSLSAAAKQLPTWGWRGY